MTVMRGYLLSTYRRVIRAIHELPLSEWGDAEVSSLALLRSSASLIKSPQVRAMRELETMMWGKIPEQSIVNDVINEITKKDPPWMYEKDHNKNGLWSIIQIHRPDHESWVASLPTEEMVIETIETYDPSLNDDEFHLNDVYMDLPEHCSIEEVDHGIWRSTIQTNEGEKLLVAETPYENLARNLAFHFQGRSSDELKDSY